MVVWIANPLWTGSSSGVACPLWTDNALHTRSWSRSARGCNRRSRRTVTVQSFNLQTCLKTGSTRKITNGLGPCGCPPSSQRDRNACIRAQIGGTEGSDGGDGTIDKVVRELPPTFTVLAGDGKWRVRQINKGDLNEVRRVVIIQAEGFHVPNPLPFVDGFLRTSFTAEVLSEMQKKLKYNPVDKFVCLVVERADGTGQVEGVVEVSYIDEKEVLSSLEPGMPGVVYVASMAVAPSTRRQGAAKALLEGAVGVTKEWGEMQAVLHVYQDNGPAVALYGKEGFETIFQDSPLWAKVGVRPRFLMRKRL